jgi:hypothetical protein
VTKISTLSVANFATLEATAKLELSFNKLRWVCWTIVRQMKQNKV